VGAAHAGHTQAFGKKAGSVLKRSFELRIKFSAGRQFSASKSASSPSAKPLAVMVYDN